VDIELFSITKVAKQLNVSRQTIYNKLDELNELKTYIVVKNNIKYLMAEGIDIIRDNIKIQVIQDTPINEKQKGESEHIDNSTIEFFKDELNKKDELYNKYILDLKQNNEDLKQNSDVLKQRIEHLEKESLEKNKLLENMQVLLKDQKLLTDGKESRKWWKFWKS
jgi:hypothetical protein